MRELTDALIKIARALPAPVVNVTVAPTLGERVVVTKHDAEGRILEFEKHPLALTDSTDASDPALPAPDDLDLEPVSTNRYFDSNLDWLVDTDPRPLYVYRPLLNSDDVVAWARAQGFRSILPDLHVTTLYSTAPVDWSELGDEAEGLEVDGGARTIERLGDQGAVVLRFDSPELVDRHYELVKRGGSHDFDQYKPHLTISYAAGARDLTRVPYTGPLIFGPEVFKEIEPGKAFVAPVELPLKHTDT